MSIKEIMNKSRMAPRGLRHKLWATFALGTIIPILLLIYVLQEHAFKFYPRQTVATRVSVFDFVLRFVPMENFPKEIVLVLILAVALALVGICFIKNMVSRILKLTDEARSIIHESNFTHQIRLTSEDEIGELRDTLNFVIARLQQNMQDLEKYESSLVTSEKEKHRLLEKTRTLTVKDEITGLYNAQYFKECWKEEIRRATLFQRPCSLAALLLKKTEETGMIGKDSAHYPLKEIAGIIKDSLKGVEKTAYIHPGEFMVLLPEKNKKEALVAGEMLIKRIKELIVQKELKLFISAGVTSSPLDGVESAELIFKVKETAEQASKKGKWQILGY